MAPTQQNERVVPASLRALLTGIVDYAGLFPPAALSLDKALRHYAQYRRGADAWMLSRFVIPVHRLDDLASYDALFGQDPPFRFSMLGSGGEDGPAFCNALTVDIEGAVAFHRQHPGTVRLEAMEVPFPSALLDADGETIRRFLDEVGDCFSASALPSVEVFFEVPLDGEIQRRAPVLFDAIAAYNRERSARMGAPLGVKMRTGGSDADAIPAAAHVAATIGACRDAGVPFKATAGLHHPWPHYDEAIRTETHGFVNLFGAAVLAVEHAMPTDEIQAILEDAEREHFQFTHDTFSWSDVAVETDIIRRIRREVARSFGSCSFDEPREDLAADGLL